MKLGCGGCLGTLIYLALLLGAVGGTAWVAVRALGSPDPPLPEGSVADAQRGQVKIFAILRAGEKRSGVTPLEEHAVTDREINGFISRHLGQIQGTAVEGFGIRFVGDGVADLYAQLALRRVIGERVSTRLSGELPAGWADRPLWLRLSGPVHLQRDTGRTQPRALRMDVSEAFVGRQRVPAEVVGLLLGEDAARLLRWRVPDGVEGVTIEPGRAVVRMLSSPPRSGSEGRR